MDTETSILGKRMFEAHEVNYIANRLPKERFEINFEEERELYVSQILENVNFLYIGSDEIYEWRYEYD
jgi:hypothetical protein